MKCSGKPGLGCPTCTRDISGTRTRYVCYGTHATPLRADSLTRQPPLIALYSSVAQSGKSTVAKVLEDRLGYWPVKFAGPLKDMVRGLLSSMFFDREAIEEMVEGDLKNTVIPGLKTVTPRGLMQTLGTDWGREAVEADLWINVAMMKVRRSRALDAKVVVDDLRFPNEFYAIKAAGGTTIRIIRPGQPLVGSSRYEGLLDGHHFDHTIINHSSIAALHGQVLDLYGPALRGVPVAA